MRIEILYFDKIPKHFIFIRIESKFFEFYFIKSYFFYENWRYFLGIRFGGKVFEGGW